MAVQASFFLPGLISCQCPTYLLPTVFESDHLDYRLPVQSSSTVSEVENLGVGDK
jgi:hypothetical protein